MKLKNETYKGLSIKFEKIITRETSFVVAELIDGTRLSTGKNKEEAFTRAKIIINRYDIEDFREFPDGSVYIKLSDGRSGILEQK
jgi:hypothetical protein